jgi:uncharacterized protein YfiM (DUF2279 family)
MTDISLIIADDPTTIHLSVEHPLTEEAAAIAGELAAHLTEYVRRRATRTRPMNATELGELTTFSGRPLAPLSQRPDNQDKDGDQ